MIALTFTESAKLRALPAVVPYVSRAILALAPHVPPVLCAPVFQVPRALCGLVPRAL